MLPWVPQRPQRGKSTMPISRRSVSLHRLRTLVLMHRSYRSISLLAVLHISYPFGHSLVSYRSGTQQPSGLRGSCPVQARIWTPVHVSHRASKPASGTAIIFCGWQCCMAPLHAAWITPVRSPSHKREESVAGNNVFSSRPVAMKAS